ncbi:MAG: RHS repeat-associated core domain-containing protein [Candidatus Brocadiia bacterium]
MAEYKYDGKTRRVLKVVSNKGDLNGTTRFVWGGNSDWQCLEERDGAGNLVARFTYAPGYIDAPARQERDLNADDDFGDDDEVVWYHSNTLYSVYALTDAGENVVERYRYDAYGAWTVLDSDFSTDADNASDVDNPYLFTARRLDAESGLMQYRHRYYPSVLGRFISRDSVWQPDLYVYVKGQPVRALDPLGQCVWHPRPNGILRHQCRFPARGNVCASGDWRSVGLAGWSSIGVGGKGIGGFMTSGCFVCKTKWHVADVRYKCCCPGTNDCKPLQPGCDGKAYVRMKCDAIFTVTGGKGLSLGAGGGGATLYVSGIKSTAGLNICEKGTITSWSVLFFGHTTLHSEHISGSATGLSLGISPIWGEATVDADFSIGTQNCAWDWSLWKPGGMGCLCGRRDDGRTETRIARGIPTGPWPKDSWH